MKVTCLPLLLTVGFGNLHQKKEAVYDGYVKTALAKVCRSLIVFVDKDLRHYSRPRWPLKNAGKASDP